MTVSKGKSGRPEAQRQQQQQQRQEAHKVAVKAWHGLVAAMFQDGTQADK